MTHQSSIRVIPGGNVENLRRRVDSKWNYAVNHRFVDELFNGRLPNDVLAKYLIQDYQFFETALSQVGACVAFATSLHAKLRFAKQLGFLASNEGSYFERSFDELGVSVSKRKHPALTETTESLLREMNSTIFSRSYAELLAMLVVAEWLYLDWGEREPKITSQAIHLEWIDLHRGEDFRMWTQFLVDELENAFPTDDNEAANRVIYLFENAVKLEGDFFDESFRKAQPSPLHQMRLVGHCKTVPEPTESSVSH